MKISIELNDNQIGILSAYLTENVGIKYCDDVAIINEVLDLLKDRLQYMADSIGIINDVDSQPIVKLLSL